MDEPLQESPSLEAETDSTSETSDETPTEESTSTSEPIGDFLTRVGLKSTDRFKEQRRILSFTQYLELFRKDPVRLGRNAAQYLLDAYESFGIREVQGPFGYPQTRFVLFDAEFENGRKPLFGHEPLQWEIYQRLQRFAGAGRADRLLLMHGPNGSAKSTVVDLIMRALEFYSLQEQGSLFSFNWIFPVRMEGRERFGLGKGREGEESKDEDYAFLDDNMVACKLPCEMREHPLFLIPPEERYGYLKEALESAEIDEIQGANLNIEFIMNGELSAKSKMIYDALMTTYHGNWRKIVKHVQVERYFISRRYRKGAVTIEPQQAVDASLRPLTFDQGPSLPPALQGAQLIMLTGDLVDASGGVVEYSDFLKRQLELNKYLLNTCERGTITVGGITAELNTVMFGSCNEKQLSAFKSLPDFPSYKGRIELLRMPYLREWKKEEHLYEAYLNEISDLPHVAPHTTKLTALWAVLTRLHKPDPGNYPDKVTEIVKKLTPLEKALFYNDGSLPEHLSSDQRRELASVKDIMWNEYNDAMAEFEEMFCAAYEGRRGASAREIMSMLGNAISETLQPCLSPHALFRSIEELVRDPSVYEFLRLPANDGYHDQEVLLNSVRSEYLRGVTIEIYDSLGLIEPAEYERRVNEYFQHVRAYVSGEKVRRPADGAAVPPSEELMKGLEKHLNLKEPADQFRKNLVSRIAAFAIDNPDEKIDYTVVCAYLFQDLKRSYYNEKRKNLEKLCKPIPLIGTDDESGLSKDEVESGKQILTTLREKYGYCDHCAREAVIAVLRAPTTA